jgi:hypothetical protein
MEEPQARVSPESYNWSRTEYYSKSMPHANPQPMPPILSVHHGVRSPCNKTMERKYQISHAKSSNMLLRTVLENIQDILRGIQRRLKKKKTLGWEFFLILYININPASRTDPNQRDWHGGGVFAAIRQSVQMQLRVNCYRQKQGYLSAKQNMEWHTTDVSEFLL